MDMKADKITKIDRFELNLTSTKIDTFIFSEFIKSKKMAGLPDPDDDYVVDTDPPVDNNTPIPPSIGIFLFQDWLFVFLEIKKISDLVGLVAYWASSHFHSSFWEVALI